ncbi:MAG: Nif3-like dinuclear metal center hexameric protein [Caldilineaceae bacterium]
MQVREVAERIIAACNIPPLEQTCDQLITGDWDREVTGIVTTFMATVDVIHEAVAQGANLIITHEPIYFTHLDQTEWLQTDPVYQRKQALIAENGINIWRFHDHMHRTQPDLIYAGLNQELGWESYWLPAEKHCYQIPATTVAALSALFKEKLDVKTIQIIGKPETTVERVGVLVGAGSMGLGSEPMPMQLMKRQNLDVIICGEILEWTLAAYVRDAAQLGLNKALIILGHNRSEEVGMKHLTAWLEPLLPGIPIRFAEAGEPFAYL